MAYKRKEYTLGNVIEVEEYHTARYGAPGQERKKRKKLTPEQMEKQNQRNKEKTARRKLRAHFQPSDYYTTLTYSKNARPPKMDAAKADWSTFLKGVRREYTKRGYALKWMRNIECGTRGAWHIHLIINRIPDTDLIIAKHWKHGKAVSELMYEKGEFAKLAAYITKSEKTDPRLREASYDASRNLPIPPPVEKTYTFWHTWHAPRVKKGYYLDPDSVVEGINPVTGYPYRSYTMIKLQRRRD